MVVNTSFTVSDILENDFETVLGVINSKGDDEPNEEKDQVMSLGDFMKSI
ncbi:hypothetical protein [Lactococcus fujiensis]|uniref:Uncharacterized protein n=1 Tax=Lactococcus fujiensis JCM 16395 TaxID=1291764 RepID=A0A2A5RIS7_9LACT|nr:hypothetical protein [Lactococcus fujiensis]PCR98994.1 hypothetical protein RT41_GL000564 [Lactococcus fujiensis JCM 16395]